MVTDKMIDDYVSRYNHYRKEGYKDTPAKKLAKQEFQWTAEFSINNPHLSRRMMEGYRRNPYIESNNGQPQLQLEPQDEVNTAANSKAVDFIRWLFDFNVEHDVGSTFDIWPEKLVNVYEYFTGKRVTYQVFSNEFVQPRRSKLIADGWVFEQLTKRKERPMRFMIVKAPEPIIETIDEASQELKRLEQLEREIAELKARLSNGNGKH